MPSRTERRRSRSRATPGSSRPASWNWPGRARSTLNGLGGCGKSRLGLAVAEEVLARFADGVWFVDLSSLGDANLVAQEIALAIGAKEESGRRWDDIVARHLGSTSTLLVLDSCETVLSACRAIVELLLRSWLRRIDEWNDSLRAALHWCATSRRVELLLRLAAALEVYWATRGAFQEGRSHLAAALALPAEGIDSMWRARALTAASTLAWHQGDYAAARQHAETALALARECDDVSSIAAAYTCLGLATRRVDLGEAEDLFRRALELYRGIGDRSNVARVLNNMGVTSLRRGDIGNATLRLDESLALYRELGDEAGVANVLSNQANLAVGRGDLAAARSRLDEAVTHYRSLGDRDGIARMLGNLGLIHSETGDLASATACFEESLALRRDLGNRAGIAAALRNLGILAMKTGEIARAHQLLAESLRLAQELGDSTKTAELLQDFARLALAAGGMDRAALLFGAAERVRQSVGSQVPAAERRAYDEAVAALRASLGEAHLARMWREGSGMSLQAAIDVALSNPTG